MIIALLGEDTDPQLRHVHHCLHEAGHTAWVADTSKLGEGWQLWFDINSYEGYIYIGEQRLLASHINAAYWHRYLPLRAATDTTRSTATDFSSALNCWFRYPATRWVNGLDAVRYHQCKPAQLFQAAQLGALIPRTWVGNTPEAALASMQQTESMIVKPVHGGETATRLSSADTDILTARLARSPVTLQAYISGTNIRSYVMGAQVFHFALNTTHTDFRTDCELMPVVTTVPAKLTEQAIALCQAFGMQWCAIDWRRTPDGQYYFLEANPCPYFLYVEMTTGVDLSGALIQLLTGTAARR